MKHTMKERRVYVAVRHSTDGYDYPDIDTVSCLQTISERIAKKTDDLIPRWALANPIVRYAYCDLIEHPSDET